VKHALRFGREKDRDAFMNRQRQSEAAERTLERRRRENAAPRLQAAVTRIASLRLDIEEYRSDADKPQVKYTRHIVVERAPALFVLGCSDSDCADGGHDVTSAIMHALRAGSTDFTGEDRCYGRRYGKSCGARLTFHATATYGAPAEETAI
jgi:hypothetical protein